MNIKRCGISLKTGREREREVYHAAKPDTVWLILVTSHDKWNMNYDWRAERNPRHTHTHTSLAMYNSHRKKKMLSKARTTSKKVICDAEWYEDACIACRPAVDFYFSHIVSSIFILIRQIHFASNQIYA